MSDGVSQGVCVCAGLALAVVVVACFVPCCEWKEGGETLEGSLCCPRVPGSRGRAMHRLRHELLRELVASRCGHMTCSH